MSYVVRQEQLEELQPEWEALLSQRVAPHVFFHPSFQRAWLEAFRDGGEPLVLSVREGRRLVGVAPLLREGRRLSFLGDHEVFDYMDFVVAPGQELPFFAYLLRALADEEWDELDLRGLADGSPTLRFLPAAAADLGLHLSTELEAVAPGVELPGSWEAYLESLDKKDRHELRRKMRRLSTAGGETHLRDLRRPQEVSAALDDFFRLHTASRGDKAQFMTERMEPFFRCMAAALSEKGLVRLFMMDIDNRRAAAVLCFDCCRQLHLYNSGFDPDLSGLSVGLISKVLCLRAAIDEGKVRLDFMRGREPYKYDLGGRDLEVFRCRVQRGGERAP